MDKKIKILHLIDHLGAGGAQEIILNLSLKLDSRIFDHRVVYFFNRNVYKDDFEHAGISVFSFNLGAYTYSNVLFQLLNPITYFRLYKLLATTDTDILHIHLYFSYFIGSIVGKISGINTILYTMHAMKNQVPRFYNLMSYFSPFVTHFIADTYESEKEMIQVGINDEKVSTIHIGTNYHTLPTAHPESIREEFNIKLDQPIILNIARLHKQKGHALLIRAFKKVVHDVPEAQLIIVGSGEEYNNIQRLIHTLNLENNVHLAGYRKNILDFYDSCDIFASTSINEAIGIVILDVLARGKPVVAFDVGALHNVVIPNKTGVLIPPYDVHILALEIIKLLMDPDRRYHMGKQASILIQNNYSLEKFVQKYEKLYSFRQVS